MVKNVNHSYLKPKVTSLHGLFTPNNSLKPKNIQFIMKSKQEIKNIWHFW